jgi:pyroglutamyl-peptidase
MLLEFHRGDLYDSHASDTFATMPSGVPRILVTGFEPFAGADDNPSARIVQHLANSSREDDALQTAVLPVSAARLPPQLADLLDHLRPEVVLGLGEARGFAGVRVERVAVNLLEFRTPDNDGRSIHGLPIVPGGPAAYFTTLPAREMVAAISATGVACDTSFSAGTYLCNQMMYLALHWAARSARRPLVGFLHLPSLPTQNTSTAGVPTMDLDAQVGAVRATLNLFGGIPVPRHTS